MADVLESVEEGETIVILILIGVGVYFIYTAWNDINDFLGNLMGASKENTYGNALGQTLSHPIDTIGSIIGVNQSTTPPNITTAPNAQGVEPGYLNPDPSVASAQVEAATKGGYDKLGVSVQMWTCTGPSGSPTDKCWPVNCDASGNCTPTGAAVPASQAN